MCIRDRLAARKGPQAIADATVKVPDADAGRLGPVPKGLRSKSSATSLDDLAAALTATGVVRLVASDLECKRGAWDLFRGSLVICRLNAALVHRVGSGTDVATWCPT